MWFGWINRLFKIPLTFTVLAHVLLVGPAAPQNSLEAHVRRSAVLHSRRAAVAGHPFGSALAEQKAIAVRFAGKRNNVYKMPNAPGIP